VENVAVVIEASLPLGLYVALAHQQEQCPAVIRDDQIETISPHITYRHTSQFCGHINATMSQFG
jgi:hypothetical protein